jgi:hypothetical protein
MSDKYVALLIEAVVLGGLPYFVERRRAGCWKPGSRRDSRFLQKMLRSSKDGKDWVCC